MKVSMFILQLQTEDLMPRLSEHLSPLSRKGASGTCLVVVFPPIEVLYCLTPPPSCGSLEAPVVRIGIHHIMHGRICSHLFFINHPWCSVFCHPRFWFPVKHLRLGLTCRQTLLWSPWWEGWRFCPLKSSHGWLSAGRLVVGGRWWGSDSPSQSIPVRLDAWTFSNGWKCDAHMYTT